MRTKSCVPHNCLTHCRRCSVVCLPNSNITAPLLLIIQLCSLHTVSSAPLQRLLQKCLLSLVSSSLSYFSALMSFSGQNDKWQTIQSLFYTVHLKINSQSLFKLEEADLTDFSSFSFVVLSTCVWCVWLSLCRRHPMTVFLLFRQRSPTTAERRCHSLVIVYPCTRIKSRVHPHLF